MLLLFLYDHKGNKLQNWGTNLGFFVYFCLNSTHFPFYHMNLLQSELFSKLEIC